MNHDSFNPLVYSWLLSPVSSTLESTEIGCSGSGGPIIEPSIARSEFEAGKVGVQVVVGASSHLGQGELRGEYVKSQMYEVTKERRKEGRKAP